MDRVSSRKKLRPELQSGTADDITVALTDSVEIKADLTEVHLEKDGFMIQLGLGFGFTEEMVTRLHQPSPRCLLGKSILLPSVEMKHCRFSLTALCFSAALS
jgi:hypothetical protein